MESVLRVPGLLDDGGRRAALPVAERVPEKGMMPIVPGRFDEDPAQVGIAGFGDVATRPGGATRVLGRDEAGEGHDPRRRGKPAGIAEFGGDRQGREIVDAAETPEPLDARSQRLDRQQVAQFGIDRLEAADRFIDGADIGAVGLLERGQRPALRLQPLGVPLRPGFFRRGEAPAWRSRNLDRR